MEILDKYYFSCFNLAMNLQKPKVTDDDFDSMGEVDNNPLPVSTPVESPPYSAFDEKEFADALETEKGSMPLINSKHERFVRAIFGGSTQVDSYLEAISATANKNTAKTESRRMLKRPEIAMRLEYLQTSIKGMDMPVTRIEAVRACSEIMRSDFATPDSKLKAIDRLGKMFKWFDVPVEDPTTKAPDPAYLHQFIKRSQSNMQALD